MELIGMRQLARFLTLILVLLLVPGLAHPNPGSISEADAQSIRTIIEAQLAAFAADDAPAAFSFASENIQKTFGTPENFMAMVRASYPVVYRPATVGFLEPEAVEDAIIQAVEMADDDDRLWLALYRMQRQPDNSWRIDGCVLRNLPGSRS
jgi:hypothetical protein